MKIYLCLSLTYPFQTPNSLPALDSTNQLINSIAVFNPILKNKPLVSTSVVLERSVVNSTHYVWAPHLFDMCVLSPRTHQNPNHTHHHPVKTNEKPRVIHLV